MLSTVADERQVIREHRVSGAGVSNGKRVDIDGAAYGSQVRGEVRLGYAIECGGHKTAGCVSSAGMSSGRVVKDRVGVRIIG